MDSRGLIAQVPADESQSPKLNVDVPSSFFSQCLTATIHGINPGSATNTHHRLSLPANQTWIALKAAKNSFRSNHILIPPFYTRICDGMRAVIKEETQQKIGARLYLTGSSGTGKSAFIHYLVWNILQNEPETWCVYNPRAGEWGAEIFYKKRIYLCFDMKECVKILSRLWNEQEGQGYLIYDSMMPVDLGVLPPEAVRQILVSSYGLELENADVRKWLRRRCWQFVMPAWRKRDVTEMTKLCYPNNALEAMEKYYQLWGGKPGLLVNVADGGDDFENRLIRELNRYEIDRTMRTSPTSIAAYSGQFFTLVPHEDQYPVTDSGGRLVYGVQKYHIEWASERIIDIAVTHFLQVGVAKVADFINASSYAADIASLRGILYERFAHRLFTTQNSKLKWRSLEGTATNSQGQYLSLEPKTLNLFKRDKDIKGNCYNQPAIHNYPTIDALIPDHGLLFQMTVSAEHDVIYTQLETLRKAGVFERFFNTNAVSKVRLVFVTDSCKYETFSKRPYKNLNGTIKKRSVDWIEQMVCQLDATS